MTVATTKLVDSIFEPFNVAAQSWTAFTDRELVTPGAHLDNRERLIEFVRTGRVFELAESVYDEKPNMQSVTRAAQFIDHLPAERLLPKVSSDGEGDLLLVWDGHAPVLVTVEGNKLHVVINAGDSDAVHFNDISYLGGDIPSAVVKALPLR